MDDYGRVVCDCLTLLAPTMLVNSAMSPVVIASNIEPDNGQPCGTPVCTANRGEEGLSRRPTYDIAGW